MKENYLAIIPARGGSQGLPGKNMKKINGVSLVGRAVQTALKAKWIDKVLISTDSAQIADEAIFHGAECIALRPDNLSMSNSLAIDVWRFTWLQAEEVFNKQYHNSLWLEPTSPCRTIDDLQNAYIKTKNSPDCDGVISVSLLPSSANPNKLLKLDSEAKVSHYKKYNKNHGNRQFNPEYSICNGLFYLKDRISIIEKQRIITPETRGMIIDRPVANIDTQFDLEYAEWLLNRSND